MNPSVTVVVVNWNGWRDTLACIEGCAALDYDPVTMVVVDNGSTDESVDVFRERLPDAHVVTMGQNLGFGAGCNTGAEAAARDGAEFVWFLNNDAWPHAAALKEMVAVAVDDTRIGAVGSVVYEAGDPDVVQAFGGGKVRMLLGVERHFARAPSTNGLDWITGTSMLVRTTAFEEVGGFDESFFMYWEDTDLGFRMRARGWRLAVAPRAFVWHEGGGSLDRRNPRGHEYFNESAVRFFRKHGRVPPVPIVTGVSGRALKQAARGRFACAKAALAGALGALRDAPVTESARRGIGRPG